VLIDLPLDVQMADIPFDPDTYAPLPIAKAAPDAAQIARAMDLLLAAEKPVLIMGGGVLLAGAAERMVEFAEYLSLPVITTYMGTGGIPANHPLHVGHIGIQVGSPFGNRFFLDSDLVFGIGCRFSDRHTGRLDVYTRGRKFIHINVEPDHIGRIVPTEVGIVADAGWHWTPCWPRPNGGAVPARRRQGWRPSRRSVPPWPARPISTRCPSSRSGSMPR
jgi:tartronate-semialdehyde synthase